MLEETSAIIAEIHEALGSADNWSRLLDSSVAILARRLKCDYVALAITINDQILQKSFGESAKNSLSLFKLSEGKLFVGEEQHTKSLFINDIEIEKGSVHLCDELKNQETKSFALLSIKNISSQVIGWIEVHFRKRFYRFRREDAFILDIVAEYTRYYGDKISLVTSINENKIDHKSSSEVTDQLYKERLLEARQEYGRLLQYGNLIIVQTNDKGIVTNVVGDTEKIFGVAPGELISDLGVWERFVPARDFRLLLRLVKGGIQERQELEEEIRIVNQRTREVKRLLIRGLPRFSGDDVFIGWEGYAVDITEKHKIQEEVDSQRKRLSALYEISQSLNVSMDPSTLLLKGLQAMLKATNADCGLCIMQDEVSGDLDVIATEGLHSGDVIELQTKAPREALFRSVISSKRGIIVSGDASLGAEGTNTILTEMRAAIIVPLINDSEVRGVIALYAKKVSRFTPQDLDVAEVAARQLGSVLRQAEFYLTERKTSDALAFLYRLSHVLSQYLSPKEIAEHAFPIIQEEIPCKRMWLGITNDQGNIIIGQAGIGPGVRGSVSRVQIELDLTHDFLDDALKRKHPIIVKSGDKVECSGLNRIMQRLSPGTLVLVPLVALGQVIGLLVIEPVVSSGQYAERKLPLLSSLGNELGSLILARRFESRISDAEKMRMASLFAAGVAHNFNNMLQAIMGHASLISLQVPAGSSLSKAADFITESATRGASLVQQLKSFSSNTTLDRKNFSIHRMINDSKLLYQSLLGSNINMVIELEGDARDVYGDEGQIQRVMSNILVNAKEALSGVVNPTVTINSSIVRLRSGEVHPELAPGTYCSISISDNGKGIELDKVQRIFEPFYTTKSVDSATGVGHQGSGLGLSSAYNILKQHDGILAAQSEFQKGSTFTLYLPVSKAQTYTLDKSVSLASKIEPQIIPGQSVQDETVKISQNVILFNFDPLTANSIIASVSEFGVSAQKTVIAEDLMSINEKSSTGNLLVVFDADNEDSRLLSYVKELRQKNPRVKIALFCIDGTKWSSTFSMMGPMHDLEIIEKSLGIWALQSAVRRMLGIRINRSTSKDDVSTA